MRCKTLLAVGACGSILLLGAAAGWSEPALEPPGAMAAAVEECATCHEEHVLEFGSSPHFAIDEDLAARVGAASSCAACHGDAGAHLEAGGGQGNIFAFGQGEAAASKSEVCQSCHAADSPRFAVSAHGRSGLDCASCHSVHASPWQLIKGGEDAVRDAHRPSRASDTCADCHGDVFAQFEWNERHRLQEGVLECASCHDPHEPTQRWSLGGFKQAECATCHVDKTGPFVFEHGSVRGESCTSCHTPHGSPNRHMLLFQNVAELCYSCHGAVPGFHARFVAETQCTSCHSTIHGSQLHPAFLK